jgi:hypothetical protein
MSGDIPPLPQYDFMVWCSVKRKAQGQLYLLPFAKKIEQKCTNMATLYNNDN